MKSFLKSPAANRLAWLPRGATLAAAALFVMVLGGCASDEEYSYDRRYAPYSGDYYGDFGPYYGDYGEYYGGEFAIGDFRHRGYYGGHHFYGESFSRGGSSFAAARGVRGGEAAFHGASGAAFHGVASGSRGGGGGSHGGGGHH